MSRALFLFLLLFLSIPYSIWATEPNCPVTDDPIAQFAVDFPQGCSPLTVQFIDISQNAETYLWSFENGNPATSTEAEPNVSYSIIGKHLATMIVSNSLGSDTFSFAIKVKSPPPHANFNFQLSGTTATFTNLSESADHYLWEFGDGTTSTETNPTHTYEDENIYLTKLHASNDCTSDEFADAVVLTIGNSMPNHTANDFILDYNESFLPGVNLGYFPPWKDTDLADIAAGNPEKGVEGVGIKTIRPSLPEFFLEQHGYDARLEEFQHYRNLKLKDNTLIVGFPSEAHRDPNFYCEDHQSELFANLYSDIWDNGENGTPVNDSNYLALYLYRMVNLYKDDIKFWEIWNEPGFDFTFTTGFLPPGSPGNWWENNPDPCDYKLRAPIFHYVRTLRVAYEVIKYIDPDAYVTLASVGFQSFLDAVLRNTDNPNDGSVTSEYPLGGGAYFDVVTIHSYPHFDGTLRYWDQNTMSFVHSRHSDKAAGGIARTKGLYQETLATHGYDGHTFPEKKWIITEINIPRKEFGEFIGGEEVQVNYMIKAYIEAVKNDILAMHIFDMAESHTLETAVNEFQVMGLFQRLFEFFPYDHTTNQEAYALKTTSDLLYSSTYDVEKTNELQLPDSISGAAFLDKNGQYTYALWATTSVDRSEDVNAIYSFPEMMNIDSLEKRIWDFGLNQNVEMIDVHNISLNARPIFLTDINQTKLIAPTADFEIDNIEGCTPMEVTFNDRSSSNVSDWIWTFEGGDPMTSTEQHPVVTYTTSGTYEVKLQVSNEIGVDSLIQTSLIVVDDNSPVADFDIVILGQVVTFINQSENARDFYWDLDDGFNSTEMNLTHDYSIPAFYDVKLIASNGCGSDTSIQTIIVSPNEVLPISDFSANVMLGCLPFTVEYTNLTTSNATEWFWNFPGGSPSTSSEQNPVITYDEIGSHWVKLTSKNESGSDSKFRGDFIEVIENIVPKAAFDWTLDEFNLTCTNHTIEDATYQWSFGDGMTSTENSPQHTYATSGVYAIQLIASNLCGADTLRATIIVCLLYTSEAADE